LRSVAEPCAFGAVTVNSTAAQQVLWRGMPLKVFGSAVYDKPEFVSTQVAWTGVLRPRPTGQMRRAYRDYRHYPAGNIASCRGATIPRAAGVR
jgi:capsule polysaccharide modification protein KpsS